MQPPWIKPFMHPCFTPIMFCSSRAFLVSFVWESACTAGGGGQTLGRTRGEAAPAPMDPHHGGAPTPSPQHADHHVWSISPQPNRSQNQLPVSSP